MTVLHLEIPTAGEPLRVQLSQENNKLFILGANGTGKSALLHHIHHQQTPNPTHKVAAYRQTYFTSGTPDMSGTQYKKATNSLRQWDATPQSRYMETQSGYSRTNRTLAGLLRNQRARDRGATKLLDGGDNKGAAKYVASHRDPFEIINGLFEASGITVRIFVQPDEPETIAARSITTGRTYTIEQLSDGERNGLLLAAEILPSTAGTIFLLDEPERHLHRSIISPLLSELFEARNDCYFVISTHEVLLPDDCGPAPVLIVRGCEFDAQGVANRWHFDMVPPGVGIDDDFKVDIWGARQKLLYVEGRPLGPDERLYSTLFPEVTVKAKGSCKEVIRSVEDVRSESKLHWLEIYGLIDGDTLNSMETDDLQAKGIFTLPLRAVESIYYGKEVREALANRQAEHLDHSREELIAKARQAVLDNVDSMKELPAVQQTPLSALAERQDAERIVADYPIGKSAIPQAIATCLDYRDKKQYEQAARTLIKNDDGARRKVAAACGALADLLCGSTEKDQQP